MTSVFFQVKFATGPRKGKEKPKKEADHSRLAGGRFNKQGNIHARHIVHYQKMNRFLHPLTRILEVYIKP